MEGQIAHDKLEEFSIFSCCFTTFHFFNLQFLLSYKRGGGWWFCLCMFYEQNSSFIEKKTTKKKQGCALSYLSRRYFNFKGLFSSVTNCRGCINHVLTRKLVYFLNSVRQTFRNAQSQWLRYVQSEYRRCR